MQTWHAYHAVITEALRVVVQWLRSVLYLCVSYTNGEGAYIVVLDNSLVLCFLLNMGTLTTAAYCHNVRIVAAVPTSDRVRTHTFQAN